MGTFIAPWTYAQLVWSFFNTNGGRLLLQVARNVTCLCCGRYPRDEEDIATLDAGT